MSHDSTAPTLQTLATASASDDQLAQIMDRYLVSLEQGTPLDLESLTDQYPEHAAEIRSMAASLRLLHQATQQLQPQSTDKESLKLAKRLGDFEIGTEIGRGGMGVVYEAKQISLQRQVALKVLPFAAMWDEKQIARFRNEALAAAQLHHPNIVPVFAVGEERGVHYYAMQYIDGQSLDRVVHQLKHEKSFQPKSHPHTKSLWEATTTLGHSTRTGRQAARELSTHGLQDQNDYCRSVALLGQQAAEALHHAHEYGVVHRDIKPSNLMVDSRRKLWITDFGLARIQNSPSVTVTGDVVGTLRYMSPEQATGDRALIDTRTDIYSLGATLYELLTLQPAFPGEDRHSVLRDIESKEPPMPRSINPAIPVDLETIVLQAMSKSRDSRYSTAQAFAEDLGRFLDGKPTLARRPTIADRAGKWMRRHRSLVTLAAMFLVMLTLGSTVAAVKISQEQQRTRSALATAEENLKQAEQHFAQARRVVDRFGIQLADQLQETPSTERLRQQLLVETLQYYRGFAEQIDSSSDIQDQLAMTHLKAGVVTAKLGARRKAMAEYRTAQQLLQQLIQDHPNNSTWRSQLALSRNNLALLLMAEGRPEAAKQEFEQAIAAQEHLTKQEPDNIAFTGHLAESYMNLGTMLGQSNRVAEAIESLSKTVNLLVAARKSQPDNLDTARSLAMAYNNLSLLQKEIDTATAESSAQQSVTLIEQVCQRDPIAPEYVADLALSYGNLAAIQDKLQRTEEAVASYRQAVALRKSLVRKAPSVVRHRSELAASLNNLALILVRKGKTAEAGEAFRHANRLFQQLLEDYPTQIAYASGWAALLNNQGLALAKIDHHQEAIKAYSQAVVVQGQIVEQLEDSLAVRETLSRIYYNYGQSLQKLGRHEEAIQTALSRRQLWQNNGQRLFGVAVELAQLANFEESPDDQFRDQQSVENEVVATLEAAFTHDYKTKVDLSSDPRFRHLHNSPQFQKLIAATLQQN